jgi:hypothetical protein
LDHVTNLKAKPAVRKARVVRRALPLEKRKSESEIIHSPRESKEKPLSAMYVSGSGERKKVA